MIEVRPATDADWPQIWPIFRVIVQEGDSYAFDPAIPEAEARAYWMAAAAHPFVAVREGQVVGTYILKANQPGRGAHVANASFMVSPQAQGGGIGRRMGEHALAEARRRGFRAMQFNLVVSSNRPAVALWQRLGFEIAGTLPGAFHHAALGDVDAYVMYRTLTGEEEGEMDQGGRRDRAARPPRKRVPAGTVWGTTVGYSRAVRVGSRIEVAGTTALDAAGEVVGEGDLYRQTVFVLQKIADALDELGGSLEDVVRTRMFLTSLDDWESAARAHGEVFAEIRPAATALQVTALVDPRLLIEIEATAVVHE